jgi:hypothetical protein
MSVSRALRPVALRHLHTLPAKAIALRSFSTAFPQQRDARGNDSPLNFFGRPRLPANKGIMFVPQQEAWVGALRHAI